MTNTIFRPNLMDGYGALKNQNTIQYLLVYRKSYEPETLQEIREKIHFRTTLFTEYEYLTSVRTAIDTKLRAYARQSRDSYRKAYLLKLAYINGIPLYDIYEEEDLGFPRDLEKFHKLHEKALEEFSRYVDWNDFIVDDAWLYKEEA